MNSRIKLATISDNKTSSLSCLMFPWQQLYLSNNMSEDGHFMTVSLFCMFHFTHFKGNQKYQRNSMLSMHLATTQIRKLSNVMNTERQHPRLRER